MPSAVRHVQPPASSQQILPKITPPSSSALAHIARCYGVLSRMSPFCSGWKYAVAANRSCVPAASVGAVAACAASGSNGLLTAIRVTAARDEGLASGGACHERLAE